VHSFPEIDLLALHHAPRLSPPRPALALSPVRLLSQRAVNTSLSSTSAGVVDEPLVCRRRHAYRNRETRLTDAANSQDGVLPFRDCGNTSVSLSFGRDQAGTESEDAYHTSIGLHRLSQGFDPSTGEPSRERSDQVALG
jgi:hypothetical protein